MPLLSSRSLVNGYKIKKVGNLYKVIGPNRKFVPNGTFTSKLKALNFISSISKGKIDEPLEAPKVTVEVNKEEKPVKNIFDRPEYDPKKALVERMSKAVLIKKKPSSSKKK